MDDVLRGAVRHDGYLSGQQRASSDVRRGDRLGGVRVEEDSLAELEGVQPPGVPGGEERGDFRPDEAANLSGHGLAPQSDQPRLMRLPKALGRSITSCG